MLKYGICVRVCSAATYYLIICKYFKNDYNNNVNNKIFNNYAEILM